MSKTASTGDDLRRRIIEDPDVILDDREVMRALFEANGSALGGNVVDLRGLALERLEERLDRLEDTHRSVIAAAYENLAGTNQVHRAVLRLLEPEDFPAFLEDLGGEVAEILRVDCIRLVLESVQNDGAEALARLDGVIAVVGRGFVDGYLTQGRRAPVRPVVLRQIQPQDDSVYGRNSDWIRSEACLRLDLGPGRLPGMLALGSEDPHQFKPTQGTDLLGFFGGTFERVMRRWLG